MTTDNNPRRDSLFSLLNRMGFELTSNQRSYAFEFVNNQGNYVYIRDTPDSQIVIHPDIVGSSLVMADLLGKQELNTAFRQFPAKIDNGVKRTKYGVAFRPSDLIEAKKLLSALS